MEAAEQALKAAGKGIAVDPLADDAAWAAIEYEYDPLADDHLTDYLHSDGATVYTGTWRGRCLRVHVCVHVQVVLTMTL